MNNKNLLSAAAAAALLILPIRADDTPPGFVDFGRFSPPVSGGQFVEVNIKSGLLGIAARITENSEPDVANLLRGLQAVRVNVVGIDEANRGDLRERLESVRRDLDLKGWDRVVAVQEKSQEVGVYLKQRADQVIEGIVVTVISGDKEAVFVNVVGDIRPEQLATLGDKLNIEPLKQAGKMFKKS